MMRILVLACLSFLLLFGVSCTEEEEPRFIAVVINVVNQASGTGIEGAAISITTSNGFSFQFIFFTVNVVTFLDLLPTAAPYMLLGIM